MVDRSLVEGGVGHLLQVLVPVQAHCMQVQVQAPGLGMGLCLDSE